MRDPVDIRLSWFRHVRRVFTKFNPSQNFDQYLSVDDFTRVPRGSLNPSVNAVLFETNNDYENFILEVLRANSNQVVDRRNVLVAFYEELLYDPQNFVQRLANFTGFQKNNQDFLNQIVENISSSELYPASGIRHGATNHGREYFSQRSIDWIDAKWTDVIKLCYKEFPTYAALYETLTGNKFPVKSSSMNQVSRKSSFTFFKTNSKQSMKKNTSMLKIFRKSKERLDQKPDHQHAEHPDPDDTSDPNTDEEND